MLSSIITATTAGLAGIATTALVVVGAQQPDAVRLGPSAASAATFATATEPDAVTEEADCRPLGSRLPEALREDLLAVRELPVEDRRSAVEKIHEDALAGSYGDEVQDRAETLGERVEDLRERFGDLRRDQGSRFGGRLGAHVPGASLGICLV
ncbi:MAG: hypothetical protein OSB43_10170 [Nocardioides sp.]|uniref:hypothetical protein n=1 Tax=Nocardioides sp. TaxID=35761 RepID=UPI0023A43BB8|nr:hypothetical protein [Nocardioides sp.]MDE0776627.1 hypothetical protein [Nocardioides sp.]